MLVSLTTVQLNQDAVACGVMPILTLLLIVHEYIASLFIPYHQVRFESAVACGHLLEILSDSKASLVSVVTGNSESNE